jgi:hypothetical protein
MSSVQTRTSSFALACALSLSAATAIADPVIVNGSFESPAYGAPGIYSGVSGDNWTPSFLAPIAIVNGNVKDNSGKLYGATPFGTQYLGMDVRSPGGQIARNSQVIPGFVQGQRYVFTLYAADSDGGPTPQLSVLLTDTTGATLFEKAYDLPVGGPYKKVIGFQKISIPFTSPLTGPITLSLTNTSTPPNGGSISIDNVSVRTRTKAEAEAMDAAEAAGTPSGFVR